MRCHAHVKMFSSYSFLDKRNDKVDTGYHNGAVECNKVVKKVGSWSNLDG